MKLIANETKIVLNGQKNEKEFQNDNTVWYFLLETRHFGTVEKESSAPRKFGIRTNRHRIFVQTNVITFFKLKSTKV